MIRLLRQRRVDDVALALLVLPPHVLPVHLLLHHTLHFLCNANENHFKHDTVAKQ